MVNHINENEHGHILTVEDPIEFVHESKKCLINQREVGPHTLSFANALRSALREDPDVILVGEMRDLETIRLALTGAETGHLVFGTLHTSSAAKTIDRIIDVFPAAEKEMVRAMLSESLRAVISQTLLKTKDGTGPRRGARDHDRHAGDPQPDPRGQDRADVLGDPDRRSSSACRRSTRTCRSWSSATSSRSAEARAQGGQQGQLSGRLSRREPNRESTWNETRQLKFMHDLLRAMVAKKALRPVHHRRLPAGDQGRRQDDAGVATSRSRRSTPRSSRAR